VNAATWTGLVAVVLWSGSVGLIRSVSEALGPAGGAAMVFSAAACLAALVLGLPRPKDFNRTYFWLGGALFVVYEICLALSLGWASNRAQALELGMINYLWPCLTILLAVLCGQQKASPLLWPGVVLSFAGIVWVMKGDGPWSTEAFLRNMQDNPVAYGLAGCAAALWPAYTVLTRRFAEGKSAIPLFLMATAAGLWVKYALGPEPALNLSVRGVLQVLVLGGFMATAYSCWNHGIQRGNLTLLAVASYFTPILSVLLASLWLGVRPSAGFWQGVLMVTGGSLLCWRSTRLR